MLVVSVHDVAPSTLAETRWLLAALDRAGVPRRVLKVIPHPEPAVANRRADEALSALLGEEARRGSEVVLHGWTHRAVGPRHGSLPDRLRARLFAGEAPEFLALEPDQMRERLDAGRAWLAELGLATRGFCAPGWLAAPGLADAARGAGFDYLVWLRGLRDLRDGRWRTLPPIGYMGAGPIQEGLVRLGAVLVSTPLRRLTARDVHRVFLHPQGADRSADCARVLAAVAGLARTHRSVTYGELLDG